VDAAGPIEMNDFDPALERQAGAGRADQAGAADEQDSHNASND